MLAVSAPEFYQEVFLILFLEDPVPKCTLSQLHQLLSSKELHKQKPQVSLQDQSRFIRDTRGDHNTQHFIHKNVTTVGISLVFPRFYFLS